jgi:hypothetical protein
LDVAVEVEVVNTNPGGGAAIVLVFSPIGAESIFPNPIRMGAVSDNVDMNPPSRFRTSSRARMASCISK